jgi:hypothetical protein
LAARGDHKVFQNAELLQHPPIYLNKLARTAPVG